MTGLARGVAYQLVENFGILVRDEVNEDIKALDQEARKQLRRFGVRFGAYHIFIPQLLKPAPTKLLMLLAALQTAKQSNSPLALAPHPGQGLTSVALDASMPNNYYQTAGFRKCITRAVRIDMLERLADLIREVLYWKPKAAAKPIEIAEPKVEAQAKPEGEEADKEAPAKEAAAKDEPAKQEVKSVLEPVGQARPLGAHTSGGFMVTPNMMSLVGCSGEEFSNILTTIGYQMSKIEIETTVADETAEAATDKASDDAEVEVKPTHDEVWFPARKRNHSAQRQNNRNADNRGTRDNKGGKKPFNKNANKRKFDKNKNAQHKGRKPDNKANKPKPTIAPENSPFAALLALKDKV